jgi:putative flippase GtrA
MAMQPQPDFLSSLPPEATHTGRSSAGMLFDYVRAHASQLARYLLVGTGLAVLNLAFLYGVRTWLHLSDPVAVTAMYVFGVLIHFPSHRWITYSAQDQPARPQLLRYSVMLIWNFAVMQTVVMLAARLSISPYLAVMAATGLTMISNFLAMAHVVFKQTRATAGLSDQVLNILRQRGLVSGAVLLLTSGPPRLGKSADAPQFQLTRGEIGAAATLLNQGDFAAVVLVLASPLAAELESLLATVAGRLKPDTLLVLELRGPVFTAQERRVDDREAGHLLLLRSGYNRVWPHSHGGTLRISARRAPAGDARRKCSIIVPVFNEKATFAQLMRKLLDKRLDHLGVEREIILVESNSTDGTREEVAAFSQTPGVKVLYQDRPRGKGHAVRAGLAAATGDIVLIQDADLEYDVDDYDALLEPLLQGLAAFVLGSRHSGHAKMRQFSDQVLLGEVLNFGHLCFTTLINVLYVQNMRDPFTMFKVFRRDCLYGLAFECNRFDFDHELVIKLVLKGYRPLEIPVSYRSRSFKQGKKIQPFRDALTWLAADFKYRLKPLRPRFE